MLPKMGQQFYLHLMVSMTVQQYAQKRCSVDGKEIHLSKTERDLVLCLLLARPGTYVSRNQLIDFIYGEDEPESINTIFGVYVSRIRGKGLKISSRRAKAELNSPYRGYRIEDR